MKKKEIYITGLGTYSPAGYGIRDTWENIEDGKTGITRHSSWLNQNIESHLYGLPPEISFEKEIEWNEFSKPTKYSMYGLLNGYSLLTYIDWNSGYNNDKGGNIEVDFFNSKLSVKQSISYLSYYTKTPIIPCISYYDEEFEPKWNMLKPILPDNHTGVKEYAFIATQLLYSHLEDIIRDNFSQWRGWFHIHKSIVFGESLENKQYDFDINGNYNLAEDVGTFTIIGEHFIFNKTSYKLMKLPDPLFNSISTMELLNEQVIEASIIKQLYESKMLCKTI